MIKAFVHYSDASSRKACTLLTEKFGDTGYAMWFRLLEYINQNDGEILDVSKEADLFLISKYCHPTVTHDKRIHEFLEFLNFCSSYTDEEGVALIDPDLWKEKKILNPKNMDNILKVIRKKKPKEDDIKENDVILRFCRYMFNDIKIIYPAYRRVDTAKIEKLARGWYPEIKKILSTYEIQIRDVYELWRWLHDSNDKQAVWWRDKIRSGRNLYEHFAELDGFRRRNSSSKPSDIFMGGLQA